jgi:hypothetical protein
MENAIRRGSERNVASEDARGLVQEHVAPQLIEPHERRVHVDHDPPFVALHHDVSETEMESVHFPLSVVRPNRRGVGRGDGRAILRQPPCGPEI